MALSVALAIVLLMLSSSFSGALYPSNPTNPAQPQGSHVYLVTSTIGNQNYSYYEEVQNGKVVKTWPSPAAPTVLNNSGSSPSQMANSSPSIEPSSEKNTSQSLSSLSIANKTELNGPRSFDGDKGGGSGNTFNITQTYSLTSITLSPTSSNLYVGQTLNLVGTWAGGLSPYNYIWQVSRTSSDHWLFTSYNNSSNKYSANLNFTPDHPGTYLINLTVNGTGKGNGLYAYSVISVQPQPSTNTDNNQFSLDNVTLNPTTSVMYSGSPIDFVGKWRGSSSAYNYAWVITTDPTQWKSYYEGETNQIDNFNTTTGTSTGFSFNPVYGSFGVFYLYLYVTPSNGKLAGPGNQQDSLVAFTQIILLPGTPGVTSVTISPTSINYNNDSGLLTFKGNWTGGAPPYSYAWFVTYRDTIKTPYILQFSSYNYTNKASATFTYEPTNSGQYFVYLFVNSATSPAYVMAVSQINSKENPQPTVQQITITPTTVDASIGESVTFNANWTGGISPYTYLWYVSSYFPHWQKGAHNFNTVNTTITPNAQFTYIPDSYGIFYVYLFVNNHVSQNSQPGSNDEDEGLALIATAELSVLHPSLPLTSSAISLSPASTTVGNPVTATVESGYGIAPFSYSWAVTTSGQPATGDYTATGDQITFSSPGTFEVTVTVTDSNGQTASLTQTITVIGPLTVSVAISGSRTIDSGQSATLLATSITGGTSPYIGQWLESAPSSSNFINLGNQFSVTSSDLSAATISSGILTITGTWLFELKITDTSYTVAYSSPISITVNPQLTVALSASSTGIDSGGSVTFTNSTTGGTQPYTFGYTVTPATGWTQSSNPGNTFTFTAAGTYKVTLTVTDFAGSIVSSSTVTITVTSLPTISVQPQSYSIDPEQVFSPLTSTVEYGSGTYTWQWYSGSPGSGSAVPQASGSGTSATFTPTQGGLYYVIFTDSSNQIATSNAAVVKENQNPSVVVTPSSATIVTSQQLPLSSAVSGGSGSFSYSWTIGGSGTVVGTASGYSFSESTSGTYKVWLNVTDTGTTPQFVITAVSVSITVMTAPTVKVSPPSATIDASQSIVLTVSVNGGSGTYVYAWSIGGSPTSVGSTQSYQFSESTAKTYKIWLNVTDEGTNLPYVITTTVSIVVDASPSIDVEPNSAIIDSGQSVTLTSTVIGGTGQFSWQWYDTSGAISGASGSGTTASHSFSTADSDIYVIFTDTGTSSGATPTSSSTSSPYVSVTVDPALSIVDQPVATIIDSGQSLTLSSTVTGGTGSYSWSLYTSSNALIASGTGAVASKSFSPTSTASYYFEFTDTGVTSSATPAASIQSIIVQVTVNPALVPGITPSSATLPAGQSQQFVSTTTGGSGKYTYSWTVGGSSSVLSTTSTFTFSESVPASYVIWMNVTDTGTTVPYTLSAKATVLVNTATLSVSFAFNTPASGSGSLDAGQSLGISVTPIISGGTGPYSYQWFLNGTANVNKLGASSSATSGTAIVYAFTPPGKGTYTFYLQISSSDGLVSMSGPITISVYAKPSISQQPSPSTIDSGQTVQLTSTVIGGTPLFSWTLYSSSGTAVASGSGKTETYSFNPQSNGSYYFVFTDTGVASGSSPTPSAKSSAVSVTVYPDPTVTVLPATIGSGTAATLTATAAGGSKTGYSFKWYSDPGLTHLVYSGDPFNTPVLASTTTYYVTVTDSTGFVSSPASVVVTVVGSLTSSSLTISPTTTDVGFLVTGSVSPGSGVSPYSYSWVITLYPSGSASGDYTPSSNHVTFTKAGVYSATLTVKDSSGETASITDTITVNALPTISISPSTITVDAGSSVTFTYTSSGGTSPYTYGWGYSVASGITQTGNQFTFANTGNFTIKLFFNDSVGGSGYATATVSVNTQPVIVISTLNVTVRAASSIDSGTSTSIEITSISGTGPYVAVLKEEPPGEGSYSAVATTAQFSSTPEYISTGILTTIGQYHFLVTVTEVSNSGIFGSSQPIVVTVVNAPSSSALTISPTTTDIGLPITVTVANGYGVPPFVYAWTATLSGGGPATGDYSFTNNQITFTAAGTYSVTATVEDADGISVSSTAMVMVNAQLALTLTAVTPTTIDKGQTVTFSYSTTGGMTPYSVSYIVSSIGGGIKFGAYSISGNIITFSLVGQYEVSATVTDALGGTATSSSPITVNVNALPTITLTASETTIDSGNSVTFTNNTMGGTQPYTYIWSFPSSTGITRSVNTFTFANTGNFTITLTIVDAVGVVASASVLIRVNSSPIIVLQPANSSSLLASSNEQTSVLSEHSFQPQKKTLTGGNDPKITLDQDTPWSVYVQAGTGTPPFTFNWAIKYESNNTTLSNTHYNLTSSNSTYVDNVVNFLVQGTFYVVLTVVDKYDSTSTEYLTIVVDAPLLVVSTTVTATPSSFDLGNSTMIAATPTISGGTQPYFYQWYLNGVSSGNKISGGSGTALSGTQITLPETPATAGSYTYYLIIHDSAYSPATNTTKVTVTVNNLLTTGSIEISPTSTVIDGLINATIKSGYGTSPFNYTWTITPIGGSPIIQYGHQIGLSQAGNYTVSLKVRDVNGNFAYNNTTVRIYSSSLVLVTINSPTSTQTIDAGQTQSVTGSFSGGSGTYEYAWIVQTSTTAVTPSTWNTSAVSPQSHTFTFNSAGTFYVFLYVKDTIVGDTQNAYREVKVNNTLAQSAITISPTSTDVDSPVTASVSSGYGTAPFSYSWSVSLYPSGGSAAGDYNSSGNQLTFSKSGNYTVKVTVSDSYTSATSSSYTIDVSVVVSLRASIATYPTAGVTAIDINHPQEFQATVVGGSGSYTYSWGLSGTSGTLGTSSTYTLNVSTPGLYIVWLNVTQGTYKTSASPLTIVVNPLPKASIANGGTLQADVGEPISGSVVGGTPPYTYSWSVSLYPSRNSASGDYTVSGTTITFNAKGNYSLEFIVRDYDGSTSAVTVTIGVNAALSGSLSLINPLSSVIDRGNSSLLTVSITGGSGSFSYQWYEQAPGTSFPQLIVGAVNSTYDFVTTPATTPGVYLFNATVTDVNTDPAVVKSNIISVTVRSTVVYGLTFSESGLPSGAVWYVNLTAGKSYSSSNSSISLLEPNGTYSYTVSVENKTFKLSQATSSFTVTINGTAVRKTFVFLPVVYSVTFHEYGLITGTEWFVNLTDGQSYSSTLSIISFSETNGTYTYTIATVNKQYRPTQFSSEFIVDGSSLSEQPIQFSLLNYTVTFDESGLPGGAKWFVNLSNGQSYSSSGNDLSISEPNGSYSYTIATPNKIYYSTGGTLGVNGASITEYVTFSLYLYNISFTETGLSSGTVWNITLKEMNGLVAHSSTGPIYFNAVNGTYNFTIGGIPGYRTQSYNVTVVVRGGDIKNIVTWTPVTYPVTITESGLAPGSSWSVALTTTSSTGLENVTILNTTSDSITFNVTNGSYSYVVILPKGYTGSPTKATISVVGSGVIAQLKVKALPNYLLIWTIIAMIAVMVVVIVIYYIGEKKSLFKRDGRAVSIRRVKQKK